MRRNKYNERKESIHELWFVVSRQFIFFFHLVTHFQFAFIICKLGSPIRFPLIFFSLFFLCHRYTQTFFPSIFASVSFLLVAIDRCQGPPTTFRTNERTGGQEDNGVGLRLASSLDICWSRFEKFNQESYWTYKGRAGERKKGKQKPFVPTSVGFD